jgi:hypothetical protein
MDYSTIDGELPLYTQQVIVHCKGFRCLGTYESDKKWHTVGSRERLLEVIGWSQIGETKIFPVSGAGGPSSS